MKRWRGIFKTAAVEKAYSKNRTGQLSRGRYGKDPHGRTRKARAWVRKIRDRRGERSKYR